MNQRKNYLTTAKEQGFTLVEVIVAVAILSFVIFATLRVITASLNSITRQGQRVKALHLAQAHLAKLEAESFPNVIPEIWTIDSTTYQLRIYDDNIPASQIFIATDDSDWYEVIGFNNDDNDDGILVAYKDGSILKKSSDPLLKKQYEWNPSNLKLTFSSDDEDETVQIYYRYYHLVEEGGTIPSDGEGLKERTIKLITSAGDTDGNGTPSEKSDILGNDLTDNDPLSPSDDYESYDPETGELTFTDKIGNSVWIYYLPQKTSDGNGDGYEDPTDDSILGLVEGSFFDPDEGLVKKITNTKKVTVTEYWKQGKDIQRTEQETYITR